MSYGTMFLPWSAGRQLPFKSLHWVTRDSNRLVNWRHRYDSVLGEIDVARTEEELKISLSDVRWNDHRRLWWKCQDCGKAYRRMVSSVTKFHARCGFCRTKKFPSEILQDQLKPKALAEVFPEIASEIVSERAPSIAAFPVSSKYNADWKCKACGGTYSATIRARTGVVEPGQAPVHPQAPKWTNFCEKCTWAKNMAPVAKEAMASQHYLGLEPLVAQNSKEKIPRRRRAIV